LDTFLEVRKPCPLRLRGVTLLEQAVGGCVRVVEIVVRLLEVVAAEVGVGIRNKWTAYERELVDRGRRAGVRLRVGLVALKRRVGLVEVDELKVHFHAKLLKA